MHSIHRLLGMTVCVALFGAARSAAADPTQVTVSPPLNARFAPGQRFDIRVEGAGTGPFAATLEIDGKPRAFTSGAQNTTTTDGITSAGYGGFNLRGYSENKPGLHQIKATFKDTTGTVTVRSQFEVVDIDGCKPPVRNVIVMLGDGMGVAHRTAARLVRYGVTGGDPNGYLAMDYFPHTGMVTTHSLNSIITDSAPGMACYSTGTHSNNNQEGVFPAHVTNPFFAPRVEYMSELLHRTEGKSLGLVTTADVEDATPAANAVHTINRNAGTGICDQYLDESDANGKGHSGNGLQVLLGGGRRWFLPSGQFGSGRSDATDYPPLPSDLLSAWGLPASAAGMLDVNRDLVQDFKNAGFSYADSGAGLDAVMAGSKPPKKLLGLFAYGHMNVALDKIAKRRNTLIPGSSTFTVDDFHAPDQPMLDEMTEAALKVLHYKNKDGFVLMVEGASIDKQSHVMDPERAVADTLEFDRAVAVARKFADEVDESTIIIVLADHECSGFSIIGGLSGGIASLQSLGSDGAVLDPSVAPARQGLVGTYDAAGFPKYDILSDGYPQTFDVDGKILFGYGASGDRYETWLTRARPLVDTLLPASVQADLVSEGYGTQPVNRPDTAKGYFMRGQAIGGTQAVHTAADIPISAYSPRTAAARPFVGVQRNIDVFVKLMRATAGDY